MATTTSDIRNGLIIRFKNDLFQIVEFLHVKPGKGGAFVRTKLKSMTTGAVLEETFRSGEKLDDVRVERHAMEYLYNTGQHLVLMNTETYEQIEVPASLLGSQINFLKENMEVSVLITAKENQIIAAEIPFFIEAEVVEAEPAVKGNTVTNQFKMAKVETGAEIRVPMFISVGDMVKVDTRTGEYLERINKK